MISKVEQVQQKVGCERSQAWAALQHCNGDPVAAIELARRFSPAASRPTATAVLPKITGIMPSAEVLSAMYPPCAERPSDYTRRLKTLADASGARPDLVIATLQMCHGDVGAALKLLVV